MATCISGDIPGLLANGDGPEGCGGGGVRYALSGKRGTVEVGRYACPRLTLFAPSKSRALRKFPDGNFRRSLVGSLRALTSAKLAARRGNAAARSGFLLAALHSVAKRVSRGQAYHPARSVPRLPERAYRTPPPPRSAASFLLAEPSRYVPEVEKIARLGVLFLAEPLDYVLFSQQRQTGARCFASTRGPCGAGGRAVPRPVPFC
jgi:hypothetical protein